MTIIFGYDPPFICSDCPSISFFVQRGGECFMNATVLHTVGIGKSPMYIAGGETILSVDELGSLLLVVIFNINSEDSLFVF